MTLTYHNDRKFKRDFVKETRWHHKMDRYVSGDYGSGDLDHFRGCSVGCSVNSLKRLGRNSISFGDHAGLASILGWPEWLTLLQDVIFENLPTAERPAWTEELAAAVPVGVDLSVVKWQFCAFLMRENIDRVLALQIDETVKKEVLDSIRTVLALHEKAALGNVVPEAAGSAARSAAGSAARSAAWSAAWSAARSAAWSAARSAAESAAWSAARSASFVQYKNELLRLIRTVKPSKKGRKA